MKMQSMRDPELGLEETHSMMKTIVINTRRGRRFPKGVRSYRKSCDNSGRRPTMNDQESAMATVFTCHNYKRSGHKKKDCNRLNKKSDKSSNVENGTKEWYSYHQFNAHFNENCYHQQLESANRR